MDTSLRASFPPSLSFINVFAHGYRGSGKIVETILYASLQYPWFYVALKFSLVMVDVVWCVFCVRAVRCDSSLLQVSEELGIINIYTANYLLYIKWY